MPGQPGKDDGHQQGARGHPLGQCVHRLQRIGAAMLLLKAVGFSELQRSVSKKMAELQNRQRVNAQATVVVDRWIQKNFQQQGKLAMGGSGWRPLSQQTLAMRRHGDGGGKAKILIDTGTLRSRWKHLWTSSLAKVQSGVDYAAQHHFGKFVPVRRILPSDKQIWPELKKLYERFIGKVLK